MSIHTYVPTDCSLAPDAIGAAADAYDLALLELSAGENDIAAELIARRILHLAIDGERDPLVLCDSALASFGLLPPDQVAPPAVTPQDPVAAVHLEAA